MLEPGDSAIDAGGHIGFFTMHMAAVVGPDGRVYAFEPFDANADLLERRSPKTDSPIASVFQRAAVGAGVGNRDADLSRGNAQLRRRLPAAATARAPLAGQPEAQVPLVALDALDLRRPIRFIKMDVEGAEPQVVRGAARSCAKTGR